MKFTKTEIKLIDTIKDINPTITNKEIEIRIKSARKYNRHNLFEFE